MKLNKLALTIGIASLALVGLAHAQSQQFWMMKAVPILKPSGSGKPSPSIKLSTANLPEGMEGKSYNFDLKTLTQVTAGPGIASVEYGIGGGDLPAGISLSNDGILAGKPTTPNIPTGSSFTVYANYSGANSNQAYTIKIGNSVLAATKIVVGAGFSCAITVDGAVKCWGQNNSSQLGRGAHTFIAETLPKTAVGLDSGVTDISAGNNHACAIQSGAVFCWGSNSSGQIGNGTSITAKVPTKVPGIVNATSVSAGGVHTCAIDSGIVKCWGANPDGRLGDGNMIAKQLTPVQTIGLSNTTSISAGDYSTCAIDSGAAKCWGNGTTLGNNDVTNSAVPVQVSGLSSGIAQISVGTNHACALLNNGSAKCWGLNSYGQLGNGEMSNDFELTPVSVMSGGLPITSFKSMVAGLTHTCGIMQSGGVKCWGSNSTGRFGDGSTNPSINPVDTLLNNPSLMDIGGDHGCAIVNGLAKCWGGNYVGNLGIGNTDSPMLSPQNVKYGD